MSRPNLPPPTRPLAWTRSGATLRCRLDVHPDYVGLLQDYVLHRLRRLRAHPDGFLHPVDASFEDSTLTLTFRPTELDSIIGGRPSSLPDFRTWRNQELLPILGALVESHREEVGDFTFQPALGRWIPPVSWFVPQVAGSLQESEKKADIRLAGRWVNTCRDHVPAPQSAHDKRFARSILDALDAADPDAFYRLVEADQEETFRDMAFNPDAPSFLSLLTEAEVAERLTEMYPYRLLRREEVEDLGFDGQGQFVLEVDARWKDPHFPRLTRPSPQELWDALIEDSKTTPVLALSSVLPNPVQRRPKDSPAFRWIGVHEDQPYLFVRPDGGRPPPRGFLYVDPPGDQALIARKRFFTAFAGGHPGMAPYLEKSLQASPFKANPQAREVLEAKILATRGVLAVQGPPGTGKTYLATQVVRQFLAQTPGGRVLVCAKEHFALDHILHTITAALTKDETPFRAFRSISAARRRRGRAEIDETYTGTTATKQLAELGWAPDALAWTRFQAETQEQHDIRLTTLAEAAANLYFCTTMDAALMGFLNTASFDLVIVEEAGKCYPSELLHALCLGRTALMIGDQRQLPPYQEKRTRDGLAAWQEALQRAEANSSLRFELEARFGFTYRELDSLFSEHGPLTEAEAQWLRPFEYLFDRLPTRHRLEEQYRMEAPLSALIGKVFYGRPFDHRKAPANPFPGLLPPDLDVPLLWIDTPHMIDLPECTEDPGKRGIRDNMYERDVILHYLRRLRPIGDIEMVILTPYNAQKRLLLDSSEIRTLCAKLTRTPYEQVIRTTDEYQGREADLTILSLVRNNSLGARAWGFMTEPERLNVMFSRSRFRQVVVGCSTHIQRHAADAPYLDAIWKEYKEQAANPRCARIVQARDMVRHG